MKEQPEKTQGKFERRGSLHKNTKISKGSFAAVKPAIVLFVFTAVAAVIVGFMHTITAEPIERQIYEREQAAINDIIPNSFPHESDDALDLPDSTIWRWDSRADEYGQLLGYVFFARSRGYDGLVHLLVGFDTDGNILGVRVISHTETPGLGSVIAEARFTDQFVNLRAPVQAVMSRQGVHEIDAITGATLSINAVLNAVNDAWEIFEELHEN